MNRSNFIFLAVSLAVTTIPPTLMFYANYMGYAGYISSIVSVLAGMAISAKVLYDVMESKVKALRTRNEKLMGERDDMFRRNMDLSISAQHMERRINALVIRLADYEQREPVIVPPIADEVKPGGGLSGAAIVDSILAADSPLRKKAPPEPLVTRDPYADQKKIQATQPASTPDSDGGAMLMMSSHLLFNNFAGESDRPAGAGSIPRSPSVDVSVSGTVSDSSSSSSSDSSSSFD